MSLTPYLRRYLQRKFSHIEEHALDVGIEEFTRFARLAIGNERFFFPCTLFIDDIWHALILETRDYAAMCEKMAPGKFLHHTGITPEDYTAGRTMAEGDNEDLSVLVSYVVNFGPFTPDGVKHWGVADGLMKKQGWCLEQLNQVLDHLRIAASSTKLAEPPPDPRSLLLSFHAKHVGLAEDYFSTVKTSVPGKSTYDIAANQLAALPTATPRILDVGCGSGGMFRAVTKTINVGHYVGVDISADEIYLARRRIYHPDATFLCAEAHDLPFKDNHFDVVISHMTMHLLERADVALAEIRRVLRPGGSFVFVVPTRRCDTASETAYSEIIALFGTFRSSQTPLGATSFRTTAASIALLKQSFSTKEPVVSDYLVCLEADETSVIEHVRTMYPYASLTPEERPIYEAMVLDKLKEFYVNHPKLTLNRRMSVYTVCKVKHDL